MGCPDHFRNKVRFHHKDTLQQGHVEVIAKPTANAPPEDPVGDTIQLAARAGLLAFDHPHLSHFPGDRLRSTRHVIS
ncbi:hypothetical protein BRAS3843_330084 [Bradyrhizobium sp. STM 3843]|nr:hypothetical protein BRAS3843_330084 [Bradyrhizobium sp. STM 3843]